MPLHAQNDVWTYADTNISFIGSTEDTSKQSAQATNEKGDVMCESYFDTTTEYSKDYVTCSDTAIKSAGFGLGKVISGNMITGQSISTNAGERPKITISGQETNASEGRVYTFAHGLTGVDEAQVVGITLTGATACNSSTLDLTCGTSRETAQGEEICMSVNAGRVEVTMDLVACDTAPSYTVDTGYAMTSEGLASSEGEYQTKSVTVVKNLTPDT